MIGILRSQASELLPTIENLGDHPDPSVRLLVKSTAKIIRSEACY